MGRRARGFTLIEIAVAIAILGVGVVTLQQIYQGSLRLQNRAARQDMAVLRARMAMDHMMAEPTVTVGNDCTTSGGYRVCTSRMLAPSAYGGDAEASEFGIEDSELKLYYLEADVTWQDGANDKTYALKTLRAAPEPEE
jgi:prepilin-type N-terminal cleavage/methylation domain-containing protein